MISNLAKWPSVKKASEKIPYKNIKIFFVYKISIFCYNLISSMLEINQLCEDDKEATGF